MIAGGESGGQIDPQKSARLTPESSEQIWRFTEIFLAVQLDRVEWF